MRLSILLVALCLCGAGAEARDCIDLYEMRHDGDLLGDDCRPDGTGMDCHVYGESIKKRRVFWLKGHRLETRLTEAATCVFPDFKGSKLASYPDAPQHFAPFSRYTFQEAKTDSGPNGFGDFSAEGFAENGEDRFPLILWSFLETSGFFGPFEASIPATEFLKKFMEETHTEN